MAMYEAIYLRFDMVYVSLYVSQGNVYQVMHKAKESFGIAFDC